MTHVTCRPRTGISSGTLRSVIEYELPLPCLISGCDRRMVCAQIRVYDIGLVELDWVRVNCRGGLLTTGLKM